MATNTRSNVSKTRSGLQRGDPAIGKRKASNADQQPRKRTKQLQVDDDGAHEKAGKEGKGGREGKKEKRKGKGARYAQPAPLLFCFANSLAQPRRKTSAEKAEEDAAAKTLQ